MEHAPLVSVVTPFYNTADYLEQCITSVLSQTYREFEYVLCDNCSTDGSTEIAALYASKDSRVRFIRFEELLPQVANYNRALDQMSPNAEWCKIVQADDWLYDSCLERMIEVGALDDEVGLVSSYYLKGNAVRGWGLPIDRQLFDGKEACRYQLRDGIFFMGSPTSVMYRASLVRSRRPFYALNRYHEDTEAAYEILEHHKLAFVHQVLTSMRVGNPSIMTSIATFNFPFLDFVIVVNRFAHRFLPAEEADALVRVAERGYFRFLGRGVLELRPRRFWKYHQAGLATIDRRMPWALIAFNAVRAAAIDLLNPLSTLLRMWRRRRETNP
jgi:glycosyltransferase involved in cell wall biosynthesis